MYGEAMLVASRVMGACRQLLANQEGGVFVTGTLHERLPEVPWHDRLRLQSLEFSQDLPIGSGVYRLGFA
jgi:class 3 adenylate cyclase